MAGSRVPSEERIFSLVLALVASANGLTKHELLSSVYGYSERYRDRAQRPSLERQFERDKEQLRQLGIPVETIDAPGEPGNNQLSRYRISKAALEVPAGLSFSDRELMMLRVAALAWREGSLTDESRRAAMKLESLGAGIDAPNLGVNAGFGTSEPSAPALLQAIETGRLAVFDYQMPGRDAPLTRRVYPLQLHRFEGRWHLIAFDIERASPRVFLLSRIVGAVAVREPAGAEPARPAAAESIVERAVSGLHGLQRELRVAVRVRSDSIADAQLGPRAAEAGAAGEPDAGGWRLLRFGTADLRELAVQLAGFGGDAEVLEPVGLRDEVVRVLRAVAAAHGGQVSSGQANDGHGNGGAR